MYGRERRRFIIVNIIIVVALLQQCNSNNSNDGNHEEDGDGITYLKYWRELRTGFKTRVLRNDVFLFALVRALRERAFGGIFRENGGIRNETLAAEKLECLYI